MIEIGFSSSFKRSFKRLIRKNPELESVFWEKIDLVRNDLFDNRLRTHKLSGRLEELWSFRVTYEIRVIFFFHNPNQIVCVDIGSHDEIY